MKSENYIYFVNENNYVFWKLIFWIFDDLVISLIRSFFYCTERQKDFSQVFYYRKNVWNLIIKFATGDLSKNGQLVQITKERADDISQNNHFAIAKIRMIPKKDSLRPIMTFKRKIKMAKTNQTLSTPKLFDMSHLLLKNIKYQMVESNYGYAVFDYKQIFAKLENFIQMWKSKKPSKPLYFLTLDVEKCYDNVLSYDLMKLLNDTPFLASTDPAAK